MEVDGELCLEYIPRQKEGGRFWKTLSILPTIKGQRYTIGRKYRSRDEEGEFIFLISNSPTKEPTKMPDPLCEITCGGKEYAILAKGGNSIWINRVPKEEGSVTGLKFGDEFTFEEPELDVAGRPEPLRFLFRKRGQFSAISGSETRIFPELDTDSLETTVLNNTLVLETVLSYLGITDLKNARLVSHLWSAEGFKILRKRAVVNFQSSRDCLSVKLFQYDYDMRDNPLEGWVLKAPIWGIRVADGAGFPAAKLIDDLDWFFSKPRVIRSLNLNLDVGYRLHYELLNKLLAHVQETLETLELSGEWAIQFLRFYPTPPQSLKFRRLSEFQSNINFRGCAGPGHLQEVESLPWFLQLLGALSVVRVIHLHSAMEFGSVFLKRLNSFRNLEELSTTWLDPEGWNSLLRLDRPLRRLALSLLREENVFEIRFTENVEPFVQPFEEVLQKHAETLEWLQITTPYLENQLRIRIPPMPHLKSLQIYCCMDKDPPLELVFGVGHNAGTIDYKKHFPLLQSIFVEPTFCIDRGHEFPDFKLRFETFLENFFPLLTDHNEGAVPQVCPTLRRLDLPPYSGNNFPRPVFPRAVEVGEMFPNVHNPWINDARQRQEVVESPSTPGLTLSTD